MLRLFKNSLIIISAILLIWFLLGKMNLIPSFSDIFSSKAVRIDETPILIKDIKELAELTTMVSLDEVVVDSITATPPHLPLKP